MFKTGGGSSIESSPGKLFAMGSNNPGGFIAEPASKITAALWGSGSAQYTIHLDGSITQHTHKYENPQTFKFTLEQNPIKFSADGSFGLVFADGDIMVIKAHNFNSPIFPKQPMPSGAKIIDALAMPGGVIFLDSDGFIHWPSEGKVNEPTNWSKVEGIEPVKQGFIFKNATVGSEVGTITVGKNDGYIRKVIFNESPSSLDKRTIKSETILDNSTKFTHVCGTVKNGLIALQADGNAKVIDLGVAETNGPLFEEGIKNIPVNNIKEIGSSYHFFFLLTEDGKVYLGGKNTDTDPGSAGPWVGNVGPTESTWAQIDLPKPVETLCGGTRNLSSRTFGFVIPD